LSVKPPNWIFNYLFFLSYPCRTLFFQLTIFKHFHGQNLNQKDQKTTNIYNIYNKILNLCFILLIWENQPSERLNWNSELDLLTKITDLFMFSTLYWLKSTNKTKRLNTRLNIGLQNLISDISTDKLRVTFDHF
jgi:hypothetical protein